MINRLGHQATFVSDKKQKHPFAKPNFRNQISYFPIINTKKWKIFWSP